MADGKSIYRSQGTGIRSQASVPREARVETKACGSGNQNWGKPTEGVRSVKELVVDRKAYELSMRIFEWTRFFPAEERFTLTSQIRRSSRSICINLREAWAKRRYPAHFVSKLTDSDGETSETDTSLDFARDCGYITHDQHAEATGVCTEIGRMLGAIIRSPEKFAPLPSESRLHEDSLPSVDLTPDS